MTSVHEEHLYLLAKGIPHSGKMLFGSFQRHVGPLARPSAATLRLYTAPTTPAAAKPMDRNICRAKHTHTVLDNVTDKLFGDNLTFFMRSLAQLCTKKPSQQLVRKCH